jgi:hypothetical protein
MRRVLLAGWLLATLTTAAALGAQEQRPTPQHNRELQQHQSTLSRAYLTADADTKGIEAAVSRQDKVNLKRDVETLGKQLEMSRSELSALEPLATSDQARYVSEMRSRNEAAAQTYEGLKSAADRGDFAWIRGHILDIRRDVTGAENTRRQMMHQAPLQARPANAAAAHPGPERKVAPRTPVQRTTEPRVAHKAPTIEQKAAPETTTPALQRREAAQHRRDSLQAASLQRREIAQHRRDSLQAAHQPKARTLPHKTVQPNAVVHPAPEHRPVVRQVPNTKVEGEHKGGAPAAHPVVRHAPAQRPIAPLTRTPGN